MERLAFIKLIHHEAVEQSNRPSPMNRISILAFHDAVEQFLILACEVCKANQPTEFMKYWVEMKKVEVTLAGKVGMDRLNRCRKDFKHAGAPPSPEDIDLARRDVHSFFQENATLVFDLDYNTLDMANLMPQKSAQSLVKRASERWKTGETIQAMSWLVDAYSDLFTSHVRGDDRRESVFSFGPEIRGLMREQDVTAALQRVDQHNRLGVPVRGAGTLAEQITKCSEVTYYLQDAMRMVAVGIDYHRYHRFTLLTPFVFHSMAGTREVHPPEGYSPTQEEFDYCRDFVIAVALRLAEVQACITPPQWRMSGIKRTPSSS
ncbi:hypothetical protein [Actinomadura rubrisoli]|uniref:Uncharacterized protein n=1 Tax=Actinomadura rubrisoli TaxID=2530368 RepID=A0A4R5CF82_9ACTN|nr:hypothetical protein [Actinomadura rubrisoli]TDD97669.1 hypothetical protein E1298_01140 [Actinomadura rubrisoli]